MAHCVFYLLNNKLTIKTIKILITKVFKIYYGSKELSFLEKNFLENNFLECKVF